MGRLGRFGIARLPKAVERGAPHFPHDRAVNWDTPLSIWYCSRKFRTPHVASFSVFATQISYEVNAIKEIKDEQSRNRAVRGRGNSRNRIEDIDSIIRCIHRGGWVIHDWFGFSDDVEIPEKATRKQLLDLARNKAAEPKFQSVEEAWKQYVGFPECDQFCRGFPDPESAVADYLALIPVAYMPYGEPAPSWLHGALVEYLRREAFNRSVAG